MIDIVEKSIIFLTSVIKNLHAYFHVSRMQTDKIDNLSIDSSTILAKLHHIPDQGPIS